jgi:hypothetical protein
MRDVGDERAEGRRGPDSEQRPMHQRQLPETAGKGSGDISDTERQGAEQQWNDNAEPVRQTPREHTAQGKPDHETGIGKRRVRANDAEISLHRGQRHDEGPYADATDRRKGERDDEA